MNFGFSPTAFLSHASIWMGCFSVLASLCTGKWEHWHLGILFHHSKQEPGMLILSLYTLSEQSLAQNQHRGIYLVLSFFSPLLLCLLFLVGSLFLISYLWPLDAHSHSDKSSEEIHVSSKMFAFPHSAVTGSHLLRCPSITFPISFRLLNSFKQTPSLSGTILSQLSLHSDFFMFG